MTAGQCTRKMISILAEVSGHFTWQHIGKNAPEIIMLKQLLAEMDGRSPEYISSFMIQQNVLMRTDVTPTEKIVFSILKSTERAFVSRVEIARKCGLGERTIYRAISELKKKGLIPDRPAHANQPKEEEDAPSETADSSDAS